MVEKSCFGPLMLNEPTYDSASVLKIRETQQATCVLCEDVFQLPDDENSMLTHFFTKHRLVIADVHDVADLKTYVSYWKLKLKDAPLEEFCTTMLMNEKPDGTKSLNEKYYLLSDVLPQDKELRSNLNYNRLDSLLKRHQFEREDVNYDRECLFCRYKKKDSRSDYLKHLFEKHNFHIAKPENLIFIDDLIEMINVKLESKKCVYCEKTFKDRVILKEHMRKKGHKRINPLNKNYDKYFLSNYLEEGKVKNQQKNHTKHKYRQSKTCNENIDGLGYDSNEESDPEWSEWTENIVPTITCLFCKFKTAEYADILLHMNKKHDYNFEEVTKCLNFYHKVKIVNYIRRQIHLKQCICCDVQFSDEINLEKHIRESKHINIDKKSWDQPEFYFPTYEDDLFLCFIRDDEESWWSSDDQSADKDNEGNTDRISKEMAMSVLND